MKEIGRVSRGSGTRTKDIGCFEWGMTYWRSGERSLCRWVAVGWRRNVYVYVYVEVEESSPEIEMIIQVQCLFLLPSISPATEPYLGFDFFANVESTSGDMVTVDALPTYQSRQNGIHMFRDETGVDDTLRPAWAKGCSTKENRHGDLLNRE